MVTGSPLAKYDAQLAAVVVCVTGEGAGASEVSLVSPKARYEDHWIGARTTGAFVPVKEETAELIS